MMRTMKIVSALALIGMLGATNLALAGDDGGCSVGGSGKGSGGELLLLAAAGIILARRRSCSNGSKS